VRRISRAAMSLGGSSAINAMVYIRCHKSTTITGLAWHTAGPMPMCCLTSSARRTFELDGAYHGKAARSTSQDYVPTSVREIYLQAALEAIPYPLILQRRRNRKAWRHQVTQKNVER